MNEEELKLAKVEYEQFKLMWMAGHGYTLTDLICELGALLEESDPDVSLKELFAEWEFGYGFGSQIWPCFDEFLETEYKEMKAPQNSSPMLR